VKKRPRDGIWRSFVERYAADPVFWYVPKGEAVKDLSFVKRRLAVLARFAGQPWSSAQREYVKALKKKRLFIPRARRQTPADQAAIGRMIKTVFDWLGLAWVDEESAILITTVGEEFLRASRPEDVIEKQLWKFQLWNPTVSAEYEPIRLIPHAFLMRVLLRFPDGLTPQEYNLFVARATSDNDFNKVGKFIELWRDTPASKQRRILEELDRRKVRSAKASEPVSMYMRVDRVRPYAWRFHTASHNHLELEEGRIRVRRERRSDAEARLAQHDRVATFIEFQNAKEWFAYYGDFSATSTDATAVSVYEKRNDLEKAVEAFGRAKERKLVPDTISVAEYREARIRELVLEDFLEFHMEYLRPGLRLHRDADRTGRQYSTEVGNIDLLARNDHDSWVVIELKRDRASDKVIGQTLRYIGWVKNNLAARGQLVRGVIVGSKLDSGLKSAASAVSDVISLYSFDFKFRFDEWKVDSVGP